VTFPWKVVIGDYCWIGDDATLYNIAKITIGDHCVISQEAYLCAGTHDHRNISFPSIASPITLESECWIATRAFVGPGVRIGRGAVVGACSVVVCDAPTAIIVAGSPAREVGVRAPQDESGELRGSADDDRHL
jgi:putative colanic acid biosynthesis acetyltransferase WcaF